jgi:hypothetical protein
MRLPDWMTKDLFERKAPKELEGLLQRYEIVKKNYLDEIENIRKNSQRPRYVEIKPFETTDREAMAELARIAESDVFKFFIETLRQDVYFAGIINQADEKQVLNAAMKLKGIELVVNELHKITSSNTAADNAA